MRKFIILILACSAPGLFLSARQAAAPPSALFEAPALITSAGQSAEVQLAAVLAKKAEVPATLAKLAAAANLANHKTLILVLGASSKGMGAAGLDAAEERDRIKGLLAEAKTRAIPILCLHLGGESRRGQLTDEMIAEFLPAAKAAIIVKSGNKDGIFTRICAQYKIPLKEVDKTLDAVGPLKDAFKK